jgi:hypothetical protein
VTGFDVFGGRSVRGHAVFFRLLKVRNLRLVALKTGILIQDGVRRIGDLFMISDFLVMRGSGLGWAQIGHTSGRTLGNDQVFVRMRLFLAAIVQGLFFRALRALATAFRAVKNHRLPCAPLGLRLRNSLGSALRYDTKLIKGVMDQGQEAMNPFVDFRHFHAKEFTHDFW